MLYQPSQRVKFLPQHGRDFKVPDERGFTHPVELQIQISHDDTSRERLGLFVDPPNKKMGRQMTKY